MRIDLDTFLGPTATRPIEELANVERNGGVYIQCWNFKDDFPGFGFLRYCGEVTHISMLVRPDRSAKIDFSSVPLPELVEHIDIDGGRQGRDRGQAIPLTGIGTICGLSHLHNLKNLKLSDFPALTFEDALLPASLQKLAIFNPGKLNIQSVPETSAPHIDLLGFDQRHVRDYGFISGFSGMEVLWMNYCNGMEALPAFHPKVKIREVGVCKARRLKNIEVLAEHEGIEEVAFRFCPLLTIEDFRCLQKLPKLKRFYVSNRKEEEAIRGLFPDIEIILDRLTSG